MRVTCGQISQKKKKRKIKGNNSFIIHVIGWVSYISFVGPAEAIRLAGVSRMASASNVCSAVDDSASWLLFVARRVAWGERLERADTPHSLAAYHLFSSYRLVFSDQSFISFLFPDQPFGRLDKYIPRLAKIRAGARAA